jgi:hypothetical protein
MTELKFKRTIAFQADLLALTKDTESILFLSQAIFWGKRTQDAEGWFYKSIEEWKAEIAINRWKQREVRTFWRKIEVLEEAKIGSPPKIYFRVNLTKLQSLLTPDLTPNQDVQLLEKRTIDCSKNALLKVRKPNNQLLEKRTPNSTENVLLKCEKRTLLLIDTKITSKITTKNISQNDPVTDAICPVAEPGKPVMSPFEMFWNAYPKKTARKPCQQKWQAKKLDVIAEKLVMDINNRIQHHDPWRQGFIPNPLTYLNQERWEDEIEYAKGRNGNFKNKHYAGTHPDDIAWLSED